MTVPESLVTELFTDTGNCCTMSDEAFKSS